VAVTTYAVSPNFAPTGALDVKLIVCVALPTANDCWTVDAALYVASPAWFASILHVPTPMKLTDDPLVLPLSEQTVVEAALIASVTGCPYGAVAVTTYALSPNFAPAGALDVKLIVWASLDEQVGNLNDPILVCQLPAVPFVCVS